MARVYCGNLPMNVRERDIEDIFYKFGKIRSVDIKTPGRPPAFAFIEFDDARDAEDAVRSRDGYEYEGERLRVEMSRGKQFGGPMGGMGGAGGGMGGGCFKCGMPGHWARECPSMMGGGMGMGMGGGMG
eukprot:CAMPEP_0194677362 /NCGR_PEP_ID=MMETSP0295-20121207/9456_1 /TAXON_ID=39354 /ORGANISM="Heterosigma akashiwo, Strain CCMP2393" /LENGTH=128 /DNA_ID=CAMNT_0039562169 /DNA_START=105 /DNA_END=487 /DNA_ORIENTATION=+